MVEVENQWDVQRERREGSNSLNNSQEIKVSNTLQNQSKFLLTDEDEEDQ